MQLHLAPPVAASRFAAGLLLTHTGMNQWMPVPEELLSAGSAAGKAAFPCSPDEGHDNFSADRCSHRCQGSPVTTLAAVEHALINPVVPSS